jgi:hypothetical protein
VRRLGAAVTAAVAALAVAVAVLLSLQEEVGVAPVMPSALVVVAASEGVTAELSPAAETAGVAVPLRVSGRVAVTSDWPDGFSHGWPGIVVEAPFTGERVALRLVDGVNRWRVRVGEAVDVTLTRPGDVVLTIAGLGAGEHILRAEKLSESWEDAVFGGVFAEGAGGSLPVGRVLEVYGDSDAVGYGVMSPRRECPGEGVYLATDTTQAFAAVAARRLGAGLDLVARSGIGLIRDFSPEGEGGRMIDLAGRGDFAGRPAVAPQGERIVVVALGANDFEGDLAATDPWADRAAMVPDFAAALEDFAAARAGAGGRVILVAFGEYGAELVAAHELALLGLRERGHSAALVVVPGMDRRACDWHLGLEDQAAVADLLVAAIGQLPDGWSAVE